MNSNIFWLNNGEIQLNTHKVTVRKYHSTDKTDYDDHVQYVNEEGLHEITVNFVPKHQLYEVISTEELDTSEYAWMEGIKLRTQDRAKEIAEIAAYGSLEAYQASLPESQDAFNLDVDYRLSKIELGI